jgi:hypothetical protein
MLNPGLGGTLRKDILAKLNYLAILSVRVFDRHRKSSKAFAAIFTSRNWIRIPNLRNGRGYSLAGFAVFGGCAARRGEVLKKWGFGGMPGRFAANP